MFLEAASNPAGLTLGDLFKAFMIFIAPPLTIIVLAAIGGLIKLSLRKWRKS